jgi:protein-tyrosine phosphatase
VTALHVCFVCTGNICRSPTAAVVFTEHLRRAGLAESVRVSSAGVGQWHVGQSIDARAGAELARRGYPIDVSFLRPGRRSGRHR